MLCRVEMPSNEQIFGRFYRYQLFHGTMGGRTSLILLPLIVVIFCVIMLFSGAGFFLPLALVIILVVYFYYILVMKPVSLFRAKPGAALQTEVTVFTESGLNRSVQSEEGGMPETESVQFSALHMAVETTRDFYLFTGPTQAYLFDKQYFTMGTPADLRESLRSVLGDKFKTKQA